MDRLGVNKGALATITATPVSGAALQDLHQNLDKLEKEIGHMLTAVRDLRNGLRQGNGQLVTGGIRHSRNWAASAVLAHCYVEAILGANVGQQYSHSLPIHRFHLYELFKRAAEMGFNDGIETRKRLDVRPTDWSSQWRWDTGYAGKTK
jgi:hypothetical protein